MSLQHHLTTRAFLLAPCYKTYLTPRAADGANAPLGSVALLASAHSSQEALPIRPAANALR